MSTITSPARQPAGRTSANPTTTQTVAPTGPRTGPDTTPRTGAPIPQPLTTPQEPWQPGEQVVMYGDFSCPWSYLAQRRATVLARATGAVVDWRAVEHQPWTPGVRDERRARFGALADQAGLVTALLLPGESLPFSATGFVPRTWATVTAYAEAYSAGVGERALRLLFDAYWQDGVDVGDPTWLRDALQDELRGSRSASELVREWGYPVDHAGAPVSGRSRQLVRAWRDQWRDERTGERQGERPDERPDHLSGSLPVVRVGGREPMTGARAVDWLGRELRARRLDPEPAPLAPLPVPTGLPGPSWTSVAGVPWLERSQRAARQPRETR